MSAYEDDEEQVALPPPEEEEEDEDGGGGGGGDYDDEGDDDASSEYDPEFDTYAGDGQHGPGGEAVDLPCVLLEYNNATHALFNGTGVADRVADVMLAGSQQHFYGTALVVYGYLKAHFGITNDISLVFPDLELELHQDSHYVRELSLAELANLWDALQSANRVADDDFQPLRMKLDVHAGNTYARIEYLKSLLKPGAVPTDPIEIEDSDEEDHGGAAAPRAKRARPDAPIELSDDDDDDDEDA